MNRRVAYLVRIVVAVLASWAMVATEARGDAFESANAKLASGDFAGAKAGYEEMIRQGDWSANVFFNLGNAEFRLGNPGHAILAYERALVLDPLHRDAKANLRYLQEESGARTLERHWMDLLIPRIGLDLWVILLAIAAWSVVLLVALKAGLRFPFKAGWIVGLVVCVLVSIYAGVAVYREYPTARLGIVTADAVALRGKVDTASVAESLPAGSRVIIAHESDGWLLCRLPGGSDGWLRKASVERVRLEKSS